MTRFQLVEAGRCALEILGRMFVTAVILAIVLLVVRTAWKDGRRG